MMAFEEKGSNNVRAKIEIFRKFFCIFHLNFIKKIKRRKVSKECKFMQSSKQ